MKESKLNLIDLLKNIQQKGDCTKNKSDLDANENKESEFLKNKNLFELMANPKDKENLLDEKMLELIPFENMDTFDMLSGEKAGTIDFLRKKS